METVPPAKTLLYFSGHRPALVEHDYQGGKIITFTGPIAPGYTDLTATAFFVPLLTRTVEYLAAGLSEHLSTVYCGQLLQRPLTRDTDPQRPLELLLPDSSVILLPITAQEGQPAYTIDLLPLPGFYTAASSGRTVDKFAVNLSPLEADIHFADIDTYKNALEIQRLNTIPYTGTISASLAEFRYGRELWSLFLWIAAGLLLLEMIIARSTNTGE